MYTLDPQLVNLVNNTANSFWQNPMSDVAHFNSLYALIQAEECPAEVITLAEKDNFEKFLLLFSGLTVEQSSQIRGKKYLESIVAANTKLAGQFRELNTEISRKVDHLVFRLGVDSAIGRSDDKNLIKYFISQMCGDALYLIENSYHKTNLKYISEKVSADIAAKLLDAAQKNGNTVYLSAFAIMKSIRPDIHEVVELAAEATAKAEQFVRSNNWDMTNHKKLEEHFRTL